MADKKISNSTVRQVAKLARLSFSDDELEKFKGELSDILNYINKLNELNTENVEPTSHAVSGMKNVYREDKERPSLTAEEALKNAPRRLKDFFGVPKVI